MFFVVAPQINGTYKKKPGKGKNSTTLKEKVKVCTGSHQRALRKGSQLVLALARAPPKDEKEKQQRLMRIRRVVSHAIRPAPSPPEVSRPLYQ